MLLLIAVSIQAMWEEIAGKIGHRDQLICWPRLSENAL